ncbi:MAG: hypothetical protein WCK67_00920 [bacterium]
MKKIALANLGSVSYAISASFKLLGFDAEIVQPLNVINSKLGENNLKSELCFPLKLILGDFLSVAPIKPDYAVFYSGCDLCSLTPSKDVFLDVFKDFDWYPTTFSIDIKNKINFLRDWYNLLKVITSINSLSIIKSMIKGFKVLKQLEDLDRLFCMLRATAKNKYELEQKYSELKNKIISFERVNLSKEFQKEKLLLKENSSALIGIMGDTYSLMESFAIRDIDKKLGYCGIYVDKWLKNKYIKRKSKNSFSLKEYFHNNYGVYTDYELKKLEKYVRMRYDGVVFISPFGCNPNDAVKLQVLNVLNYFDIPFLQIITDVHDNDEMIKTRIEAFADLVSRKNKQ